MGVAYTGTRDQPVVASSGNTPTFAADMTDISAFFAVRSARRFSTVAALLASSGSALGDLAVAENAIGAFFMHTGSGWTMQGVPRYADAAARNAALTAPAVGWRSRVTTELFDRQWTAAGTWDPDGPPRTLMDPGSVGGTDVTESLGTTTLGASATFARVSGVFSAAHGFERYLIEYNLVTSAAAGINLLMDAAGVPSEANYDNQRDTSVSTTVATVRTAANAAGQVDVISLAGARHRGAIILRNPASAIETEFWNDYTVMDAAYGTSAGAGYTRGRHRLATAYDGFRLQAVSGNLTGPIRVFGLL